MTQYFFPDDSEIVLAAARGLAASHPGSISLHTDPLFLTATDPSPQRRVAIVSGGGSGHEPLHAGFLGRGMLDAAVPGSIFASPHNRQVYEASRAVATSEGVLHIVKNYTGDVINFGIAAERLRNDGIHVERVLVADDLATESEETATGRRGTGATLVAEKMLGAAADTGMGLEELASLGQQISDSSRSLAVASQALTSWQTGEPAFALQEGTLEYGVGIHGERAQSSIKRPATSELLDRMLNDLLTGLNPQNEVLLLVNGLGGTTAMELLGILDYVHQKLQDSGVKVAASASGTYIASLDMRGFSITITDLGSTSWLSWWNAPTDAPGY